MRVQSPERAASHHVNTFSLQRQSDALHQVDLLSREYEFKLRDHIVVIESVLTHAAVFIQATFLIAARHPASIPALRPAVTQPMIRRPSG